MPRAFDLSINTAFALLIGAAVAWYVASRAAVDALALGRPAPGLRALGCWLPMAIVALLAAVSGQPEIAVGVVFAASVAGVSLVIGVVTLSAPPDVLVVADRRQWAFVLPVGLLAVLAGFRAQLTLMHAAIFTLEGIAVLWLWSDRSESFDEKTVPLADSPRRRGVALRSMQLVLATLLAVIGGTAAIISGTQIGAMWNLPNNALVGAMLFAPALVIPMVGSGTMLAQQGRYTAAVSCSVGVAMLNLCVLLPLVIVAWHISHLPARASLGEIPRLLGSADPPLFFPASVWRVDAALLVVVGLWLLPVSLGRWIPGRLEGVALLVCYAAYLLMSAYANRSW
jgi:cation:H+ antiporter